MSSKQGPGQRQRDNFNHWKGVVGLPQSFPQLSVLTDADLEPELGFYEGFKHKPVIRSVLESVTNARIAVLIDVGHGCTTLSRYVLKQSVGDAVRTRTISIRLSVDDFDVDTEYVMAVFERCRDALVTSLVLGPWQRPLKRAIYAGLIGAEGQSEEALDSQRVLLASLLGIQLHSFDFGDGPINVSPQHEVDWDAVRDLAPRLAADPHELIYDISHRERIELSLQIDLSSNRYKDAETNFYTEDYFTVVGRLSSAVKAVHEQEAADVLAHSEQGGASRSMLGIMLFTSEEGLEAFTAEWDQEFDEVEYPIYGPPDVFAILAYHYPQRVAASGIVRTQAMVAIMSDQFVTNAYDPDKSLHGIIDALEKSMLEQFDDWSKARIRLEASPNSGPIDGRSPESEVDAELGDSS